MVKIVKHLNGLFGFLFLILILFCSPKSNISENPELLSKIYFDLSKLNDYGLYGAPDGLQSVSYEFCIPKLEKLVNEVQSIDSTIIIYKDSPGRIGCSEDEYLCIGNTHQKNYREVLHKLAELEYIKKIAQSFFEN